MPAGTGHGHRAVPHRPPAGMGEGLKLRWFTGDWLLVQGNGEILSDDFAQLINRNTCEVLRIRPGMFGGEKMQHIGILTDGTVVIVTRRDRLAGVPLSHRLLGLPSDGKQAQKAGMAGVQRSIPKSAHLPTAQGHRAKNHSQKRQPDHPGSVLRRRLPCRSWRKSWGLPTLSCKMEHGKAP